MDKDRELFKLKNSILKFNKNFPGKNLVFSDGNKDAKVMRSEERRVGKECCW